MLQNLFAESLGEMLITNSLYLATYGFMTGSYNVLTMVIRKFRSIYLRFSGLAKRVLVVAIKSESTQ